MRALTMETYLSGIVIVCVAIIVFMQIRLARMIDTIGEMLHVLMFHPQELPPWAGNDDSEEEPTETHWSEWDESGETDSEEE